MTYVMRPVFPLFFLLIVCVAGAFGQRLLPFQGALTSADGNIPPDGEYLIQFQIYDAPFGDTAVWGGELHRTTVNRGLVNVILGAKNRFPSDSPNLAGRSFFDQVLYLQITIDANGDNAITQPDPPLLPRQAIVPVLYANEAGDARSLNGFDWNVLFTDGSDPSASHILGSKIADSSLGSEKLKSNAVTTEKVLDGAITREKLDEAIRENLVPVGSGLPFFGNIPPSGFLIADGSLKEKSQFPELYAVIGDIFCREGDPDSQFRLPDGRGRFFSGVVAESDDAVWTTTSGNFQSFDARFLGEMGGEEKHQLSMAEMPRHRHLFSLDPQSRGGSPGSNVARSYSAADGYTNQYTSYEGENEAHNNLPPYLIVNWIIKY
jgi:microcystin-dependent protein